MRLSYLGLMDSERSAVKATITTDHPASSYGMPVIVLEDGGALDYTSAILLDYRVEKISEGEKPLLAQWQHNMPPIDINPAATLGRKGGSAKSEAKAQASRANGKKGGRPRKLAVGDNLSPTDMYKNSRNVSKLATVALIIGNVF